METKITVHQDVAGPDQRASGSDVNETENNELKFTGKRMKEPVPVERRIAGHFFSGTIRTRSIQREPGGTYRYNAGGGERP